MKHVFGALCLCITVSCVVMFAVTSEIRWMAPTTLIALIASHFANA